MHAIIYETLMILIPKDSSTEKHQLFWNCDRLVCLTYNQTAAHHHYWRKWMDHICLRFTNKVMIIENYKLQDFKLLTFQWQHGSWLNITMLMKNYKYLTQILLYKQQNKTKIKNLKKSNIQSINWVQSLVTSIIVKISSNRKEW